MLSCKHKPSALSSLPLHPERGHQWCIWSWFSACHPWRAAQSAWLQGCSAGSLASCDIPSLHSRSLPPPWQRQSQPRSSTKFGYRKEPPREKGWLSIKENSRTSLHLSVWSMGRSKKKYPWHENKYFWYSIHNRQDNRDLPYNTHLKHINDTDIFSSYLFVNEHLLHARHSRGGKAGYHEAAKGASEWLFPLIRPHDSFSCCTFFLRWAYKLLFDSQGEVGTAQAHEIRNPTKCVFYLHGDQPGKSIRRLTG